MNKEELFKKNFPQFCTEKGGCLSPFYDLFEAGVEIATAELNKGIIQSLTKENAELKAHIEKTKRCFNCKYRNKFVESKCGECEDYSKWEIKENKVCPKI